MKKYTLRGVHLFALLLLSVLLFTGCPELIETFMDSDTDSEEEQEPPGVPSGFSIVAIEATSMTLSWNAVDGATKYVVKRDTNASGNFESEPYNGSETSFTDTGLNPGTEYYFKIKSVNDAGESGYSGIIHDMTNTDTTTAPETPTGFAAGSVSESTINLEWNEVQDAISYNLYYDTDGNGSLDENTDSYMVTINDPAQTYYFVDSLPDGTPLSASTTYDFLLYASNTAGDSDAVSLSVTTSGSATDAPVTPGNLSADAQTKSSIELSWDTENGATGYELYRDGTLVYDGGMNVYKDEGLSSGTQYSYTVLAKNSVGSSSDSSPVLTTTNPPLPANFQAAQGTAPDSEIDLNWDAVTGVHAGATIDYEISESTSASGTYTVILTITDDGSTSYAETVTGLVSGADYYYKIETVITDDSTNSPLSSGPSGYKRVTTQSSTAAPTGLTVGGATQSSLDISWDADATADGYMLFRAEASGGPWTNEVYSGTNISYTDEGLSAVTDYFYAVKSYQTDGEGTITSESALSSPESNRTLIGIPDTPAGLTATAQSATSVYISWDQVAAADSYVLTKDGSVLKTVLATEYTDSSCTSDTSYEYQIAAQNSEGTSANSSAVTVTTLQAAPAAPSGLAVDSTSAYEVTLTWTGVSTADDYYIYRADESGGNFSQVGVVSTTTFTNTGLSPESVYYYKLKASNSGGKSAYTSEVPAETLAGLSTVTWDDLFVISDSAIELSWYSVDGASGYRAYRAETSLGPWDNMVYEGGDTTYIDTSLDAETRYYYRIKAYDSVGVTSPLSTVESSITYTAPDSVPSAPSVDSNVKVTAETATVYWSSVEDAQGYRVYYSTDSAVDSTDPMVGAGGATEITVSGLTSETQYWFAVVAFNTVGDSEFSSVVDATTAGIPATPAYLSIGTITDISVELNWDSVSTATHYELYRGISSPVDTNGTPVYSGTDTYYEDTGLSSETTYYYALIAVNEAGSSTETTNSAITEQTPAAPAAPVLSVEYVDEWEMDISWDTYESGVDIEIYRALNEADLGTEATLIDTVPSMDEGYYDYPPDSTVNYYWAVKAVDGSMESPLSNTVSVDSTEIIIE